MSSRIERLQESEKGSQLSQHAHGSLRISDELELPLSAITESFTILGRRGSGKTSTAVVMAEEMLKIGQPIVWIDPLGVAWGLRSDFQVLILGGEHGDIPLEPSSGAYVADFLVSERMPCVLDIFSFGENEMKRFVAAFAQQFFKRNREAVHLFVDEADEFAPQVCSGGPAASSLGALQNVVRRGRRNGIGCTLITQRSAALSKSVMTQTECLFAMQTTAPHDLKAIAAWYQYHDCEQSVDELMKRLTKLKTGECVVYSPAWLDVLKIIKIRKRKSFDSSSTPVPGQSVQKPKTLSQINLPALQGQMAQLLRDAKNNDPETLKARIRELEKQVANKQVDPKELEKIVKGAVSGRDTYWRNQIDKFSSSLSSWMAGVPKFSIIPDIVPPTPPAKYAAPEKRKEINRPIGKIMRSPDSDGDDGIGSSHRKILNAISWWAMVGDLEPSRQQVGFIAGYAPTGGTFQKYLSRLNVLGLVEYRGGGVALTEAGAKMAEPPYEPGDLATLHRCIMSHLGASHQRILQVVINRRKEMSIDELAEISGFAGGGGTFQKYVSHLNTMKLIVRGRGTVRPAAILFPESLC